MRWWRGPGGEKRAPRRGGTVVPIQAPTSATQPRAPNSPVPTPPRLLFPPPAVAEFSSSPGRSCPDTKPASRSAPATPSPGPRVSPGGGGRPCPPPRAAGARGGAGRGHRPWRGAQNRAIAATCGTALGDWSRAGGGAGGGAGAGAAPPAGGAGGVPGLPPRQAEAPLGPSWAGRYRALRSGRAPLGSRKRRSPASSSERRPHPGTPTFSRAPPARKAKPSPPVRGTPKETEAGGAQGTCPRPHCSSDPSRKV